MNGGFLETHLTVSRDTVHWQRPERVPYIRAGRSSEFDRFLNMTGKGMARFGNYIK